MPEGSASKPGHQPDSTTTPDRPDATVLVLWDGGGAADDVVARLNDSGFAARRAAPSEWRGGDAGQATAAGLALVDLSPEGIEAAGRLGGDHGVPVVYLADGADPELLARARATRPHGYLVRPVETAQLRLSVESALAAHAREREHLETRRRLERRIAEMRSRQRLTEAMMESVTEGVLVADHEGRFIASNPSARRIMGGEIPDTEMERRPAEWGFFHTDRKTPATLDEMPLPRALEGETVDGFQIFVRNPLVPEGIYITIDAKPLTLEDGARGALLVFRDVTRGITAEAELRKTIGSLEDQTHLLDTVLDNMSEAVVLTSGNGELLYINRSGRRLASEQMLDDTDPSRWSRHFGIFHADQETLVEMQDLPLVRALRGESTEEGEFFIRNDHIPEGAHVRASARPLRDSASQGTGGAVGLIRDITEDKEAERKLQQALRKSEDDAGLMQTVFTSMSEGVVVADAEGNFTLFNPAAEEIVGFGMVDMGPDEWTEKYGLFYPDTKTHIPTEELPLVRAINGKKTVEMEIFVRNEKRQDGVYIVVNGEPLERNIAGHGGGLAVFRDVTQDRKAEKERERALDQLRAQTQLMETVFDNIGEGILALDEEGKVLHSNNAVSTITGVDTPLPPVETWLDEFGIYYPDRVTTIETENLPIVRATFGGEVVVNEDLVLVNEKHPDGITLRVSARPLRGPDGSRRGGVAVFRDVTETRRAEDALAEAFVQGKVEIIDTVLHNIGNAVSSVTTAVDTIHGALRDDATLTERLRILVTSLEANREDWAGYVADDPQGQVVLPFVLALAKDLIQRDTRIGKAARRAKKRSDHIADIIRTQRRLGSQGGIRKDVNLRSVIASTIGVMEDSLRAGGVEVLLDYGEEIPETIKIQESEFEQMMVNLLKNSLDAFKARSATGDGGWAPRIRIRCYVRRPHLVFEVEDNGIGIPADKRQRIFSAGYTTKQDGTGLGLHSAANFIKRSGGRIAALSRGTGSGATIRIQMLLLTLGIADGGGGSKNPGPA